MSVIKAKSCNAKNLKVAPPEKRDNSISYFDKNNFI